MQTRTFDLLTAPLADDVSLANTDMDAGNGANVHSFANPRNFVLTVAPSVAQYFTTDGGSLVGNWYGVAVQRIGTDAVHNIRFAALVTCDTDEVDVQDEPPTGSDWPALIVLK